MSVKDARKLKVHKERIVSLYNWDRIRHYTKVYLFFCVVSALMALREGREPLFISLVFHIGATYATMCVDVHYFKPERPDMSDMGSELHTMLALITWFSSIIITKEITDDNGVTMSGVCSVLSLFSIFMVWYASLSTSETEVDYVHWDGKCIPLNYEEKNEEEKNN